MEAEMGSTENNQLPSTRHEQFLSTPHERFQSSLQDISNFETPKCISKSVKNQALLHSPSSQYFTASRRTPASCGRPRIAKLVRVKLQAFELDQKHGTCRKEQFKKEQSLKSISKSLSTWFNFLLSNPVVCGCSMREANGGESLNLVGLGKREGDRPAGWRCPKRQKVPEKIGLPEIKKTNNSYSFLRRSIEDVCSLDDLKERMRSYLNLDACEEIFDALTRVFKNIDDGRLKMKQHCPIVTDVGMKEKATSVLLSYNPTWLSIGLHIIFGGDSIFPNGNEFSEAEVRFLKILLEKKFFSHAGLAKDYAYNKRVEGLYKPGYYENLGNIILKRFFVLAIVLDRAKSFSSLPLECGIDGIDGGSPQLFKARGKINCSRQVINEFLTSEIMHGEGNLLSHLEILGFHVSYEQNPLVEYEFFVNDLFIDLQDGVKLSRATQLLLNENSIMRKVTVPSDTRKKKLANCRNVFNYLKLANLPMRDDHGFLISEEDIVSGDKELTVALLWNIFVHLQLPLLINKSLLAGEVSKIYGDVLGSSLGSPSSELELLLSWIQVISMKYKYKVDCFSSLVDGRALWCILDFYLHKEFHCPRSFKYSPDRGITESIMSSTEHTDAVYNFMLSQKLTTLLGHFPEVLQMSDILECRSAPNYRCVIILLVFLSSQLIQNKAIENLKFHKLLGCDCQDSDGRSQSQIPSIRHIVNRREINFSDAKDAYKRFKAVKEWWHSMTDNVGPLITEKNNEIKQRSLFKEEEAQNSQEMAAIKIQSYIRRFIYRRKFLKIKNAVLRLQIFVKGFSFVRRENKIEFKAAQLIQSHVRSFVLRRRFNEMIKSVILLQTATKAWLFSRKLRKSQVVQVEETNLSKQFKRYAEYFATRNGFLKSKAATVLIQSYFKGYIFRNEFQNKKRAVCILQVSIRAWFALKNVSISCDYDKPEVQRVFNLLQTRHHFVKVKHSAVHLQREVRIWIDKRRKRTLNSAAVVIQKYFRMWKSNSCYNDPHILQVSRSFDSFDDVETCESPEVGLLRTFHYNSAATKIQTCFRGFNWRKNMRDRRNEMLQIKKINLMHENSAVLVQSHVRGWITRRMIKSSISFQLEDSRSSEIQHQKAMSCFETNNISRKLDQPEVSKTSQVHLKGIFNTKNDATTKIQNLTRTRLTEEWLPASVLKLQRWWKRIYASKRRMNSAIQLQSHFKGWICRKRMTNWKQSAVVIQSCWKAYIVRKESSARILDLRSRIYTASRNIDDSMRIINKLIFALSELENMKSTRGILHTCVILNTTTLHSQKCCEKLVNAGAIRSILRLIKSVSRSVPDQEILKLSLSTIRNLIRYPHLMNVLIDFPGSIETILLEFLRNKDEGYFVAADILKKICSFQKGVSAIRKFPHFLKRLHVLAEDQSKKAVTEQKSLKGYVLREKTERRVHVASELFALIAR